jgi:hypothetical protein
MKFLPQSLWAKILLLLIPICILSYRIWMPYLLHLIGFVESNANTIQGLEALIQIGMFILWPIIWVIDRCLIKSNDSNTTQTTSSKYSVTSEYTGAVGENNTVHMTINKKKTE